MEKEASRISAAFASTEPSLADARVVAPGTVFVSVLIAVLDVAGEVAVSVAIAGTTHISMHATASTSAATA
ncbi:hypothetical protein HMPREF2990_09375 [Corynebacterium sp. HMSC071B10]|nr:hypothetical protein HMPREF2990_09375 [Corynebacterium sp. HMSC071B10]